MRVLSTLMSWSNENKNYMRDDWKLRRIYFNVLYLFMDRCVIISGCDPAE